MSGGTMAWPPWSVPAPAGSSRVTVGNLQGSSPHSPVDWPNDSAEYLAASELVGGLTGSGPHSPASCM